MSSLSWKPEAEAALRRVPFWVRPLVRRKVEERVAARGGREVTAGDFAEAEARFRAVAGGRGGRELAAMLPEPNRPGVEMVHLQVCRAVLAECPNRLVDTEPWQRTVEAWLQRDEVSERLRSRVREERILFHHKLRIALSGCPNGCSRPQIADLALVGFVRPRLLEQECLACGACLEVCPDGAVTLEGELPRFDRGACLGCQRCHRACEAGAIQLGPPAMRLYMGGKLGRHPHLARVVAEVADPAEAVARMSRAVEAFLSRARPGERFAAWWIRTAGGGET